MAASQAANLAEKAVGHSDNATIETDICNCAKGEAGHETQKTKATVWQGKNTVEIGEQSIDSRQTAI